MVPPFVDENSPTFYLQIHGEEVYRCREICGKPATVIDFLQVSVICSGLVTSSTSLLEIVLGKQSRKAFGDFDEDASHGGGKRRKKLELRLGLNCLLNQRRSISSNQSFSYPLSFQGASSGGVGHGPKGIMEKKSNTAHLHLTFALFKSLVTP